MEPLMQDWWSSWVHAIRSWFKNLPFFTKFIFCLIVICYGLQLAVGHQLTASLCLQTHSIIGHFQIWRIITSVIVHGGLLHIVFNMLCFIPIGQTMEQAMGTVQFAHLVLVLTAAEAALYIILTYVLTLSRLQPSAISSCVVGLSGVIFGLIVIDNAQLGDGPSAQRSIFGLFSLPATWYPWALLLLWQVLMPGVSFVGHLAGLLAGLMWLHGHLKVMELSRSTTASLESSWPIHTWLVPLSSFVMMPSGPLPFTHQEARTAERRWPEVQSGSMPAALSGASRSGAFARMFEWGPGRSSGGSAPTGHANVNLAAAQQLLPHHQRHHLDEPGSSSKRFEGEGRAVGGTHEGAAAGAAAVREAAAAAAEARAAAAVAATAASGSGNPA